MRYSFVFERFGAPQSVIELKKTSLSNLAPGQLRVALSCVPINPSDLIPVTGAYGHRIGLPGVVGYEGVGRVVDAPVQFRHFLGRRVLPLRGEGTWQTEVDCPAHSIIEVPENIPDLVAARGYINPLSAYLMLRLWPVRNKTILLSAAGSSCAEYLGRWAIDQGAQRVIGIYRSQVRVERLLRIGIEPVRISDRDAIAEAARHAHIAFDAVGGDLANGVLEQMQPDADFVAYGLLSGKPVALHSGNPARYHRFHLRDHLPFLDREDMGKAYAEIWPWLIAAPPSAPKVFAAREWRAALAEAERPGGRKPVLDMTTLR